MWCTLFQNIYVEIYVEMNGVYEMINVCMKDFNVMLVDLIKRGRDKCNMKISNCDSRNSVD